MEYPNFSEIPKIRLAINDDIKYNIIKPTINNNQTIIDDKQINLNNNTPQINLIIDPFDKVISDTLNNKCLNLSNNISLKGKGISLQEFIDLMNIEGCSSVHTKSIIKFKLTTLGVKIEKKVNQFRLIGIFVK